MTADQAQDLADRLNQLPAAELNAYLQDIYGPVQWS